MCTYRDGTDVAGMQAFWAPQSVARLSGTVTLAFGRTSSQRVDMNYAKRRTFVQLTQTCTRSFNDCPVFTSCIRSCIADRTSHSSITRREKTTSLIRFRKDKSEHTKQAQQALYHIKQTPTS